MRNAGGAYRGICLRYLKEYTTLQAGVRVLADDAPAVRRRILPYHQQPPEEARNVIGRQYFRIYGLPKDMTKKMVSSQISREVGWAVLPVREIIKPASKTATWVVVADEAPSETRFFAKFDGSSICNVVSIEPEDNKQKECFFPNRWTAPRMTGPRYFNPYDVGQDDVSMADESAAETVPYDDEHPGENGRDGAFESAQDSLDGAWALVSRTIRRKGKGKSCGEGGGGKATARPSESVVPASPVMEAQPQPSVQRYNIAGPEDSASGQAHHDGIKELLAQFRAEAAAAARRHHEELQKVVQQAAAAEDKVNMLAKTCDALTTMVQSLQAQNHTISGYVDNMFVRLNMVESCTVGDQVAATAVLDATVRGEGASSGSAGAAEASAVAVPKDDVEMDVPVGRGQKAPREESPSGQEESDDGRPRAKRPAPQGDFESVTDAEEAKGR